MKEGTFWTFYFSGIARTAPAARIEAAAEAAEK